MEPFPSNEADKAEYLRVLSQNVRDTLAGSVSDENGDIAALDAVTKLHSICNEVGTEELIGRVYPFIVKIYQRCTNSGAIPRTRTAKLSLAILQFFLDYGDLVLHDFDLSLRTFFRSHLSRQYADPEVSAVTIAFLNANKLKLLLSHSSLLQQFYPLLFKVAAWGGKAVSDPFLKLLPGLIGPSSFLPLFPAMLDFPTLVLALESLEKRSGGLTTAALSAVRTGPAPEALFALMDEAYTGSTIFDDRGAESGDDEARPEVESLFADLLRDENEGLAERHWSYLGMADALARTRGSVTSDRLQFALDFGPVMLELYFAVALRDVNEPLLCALLASVLVRIDSMFLDESFSFEVRRKCMEFSLKAFRKWPHLVALLKKPIIDRVGQPHTDADKAEVALQLCWAVGEYGGGGDSYKVEARELFEALELMLYENLSSSRLSKRSSAVSFKGALSGTPSQARLLCFVVTSIAKLATRHKDLAPRARVSLAKIARSKQGVDEIVWRRAQDHLGLMQEPAICSSILGPADGSSSPGSVVWSEGRSKVVANIPFYILGDTDGPPYHDYSLADLPGIRQLTSRMTLS